jgi:hypothetical protein
MGSTVAGVGVATGARKQSRGQIRCSGSSGHHLARWDVNLGDVTAAVRHRPVRQRCCADRGRPSSKQRRRGGAAADDGCVRREGDGDDRREGDGSVRRGSKGDDSVRRGGDDDGGTLANFNNLMA